VTNAQNSAAKHGERGHAGPTLVLPSGFPNAPMGSPINLKVEHGSVTKTRDGGVNVMVVLPEAEKAWLVEQAKHNFTSQSAEVLRCIRVAKAQLEKVSG